MDHPPPTGALDEQLLTVLYPTATSLADDIRLRGDSINSMSRANPQLQHHSVGYFRSIGRDTGYSGRC
jgi:hypothetical protein